MALRSGFRVGLTGGLGSGKTTVARMFAQRGAYILSADELGRELMEPGTEVYAAIVDHFGSDVIGPGQRLNRSALARIAFSDNRVEELNAIVHPATIRRQGEIADTILEERPDAVVIVESALIFESSFGAGWRERFSKLILVSAPDSLKIERFVQRSGGVDPEALRTQAGQRLAHMMPDEEKAPQCDFVIRNDGYPGELERDVERVWSALRTVQLHFRSGLLP